MKKIILSIIALTFSAFASAQLKVYNNGEVPIGLESRTRTLETIPERVIQYVSDGIIVTYNFNHMDIVSNTYYKDDNYIEIAGFAQNHEEFKPSLPQRWDSFIIPIGKNAYVDIIDSSYVDYIINVSPSIPLYTEYESDFIIESAQIHQYTGYWPIKSISSTFREYRGYNIIDVKICPIKYNMTRSIARICKKLSYKITWTENLTFIKKREVNCDILKSAVINHSQIGGNSRSNELTENYLIITTPLFTSAAVKFAEWKKTVGFRTHLEIRQTWDSLSVMNYVRSVYNNPDMNLNYLLIIGDDDNVPSRHDKQWINDRWFYFPTDFYYSCMGDSTDLESDIYLGRIPVNTADEALTVIDKIINYESRPMQDEAFYSKVLNCAVFQANPDNETENSYHAFVTNSEEIKEYMENHGKTVERVYNVKDSAHPKKWIRNGISQPLPPELQYPSYAWNGNADSIIQKINNGAAIVFHRDHGWEYNWPDLDFSCSSIADLSNGSKLPVLFDVACQCGQFNYETDCMAEAFLKQENGGCVGVIAAAQTTYPTSNNYMSKGLFEAIFPYPGMLDVFASADDPEQPKAVYRLGEILKTGINKMRAYCNISSFNRNSILGYECFGDPSMRLYTSSPSTFENVIINRFPDSIEVSTSEADAQISFYDRASGDVLTYKANYAIIPTSSDSVLVCISAPNKIPYIDDPRILFIQNITINDSNSFEADKIYIGSSVTNMKSTGPAVFNGGHNVLRAKEIEIHGGTTINIGTEFETRPKQ